MTEFKKDNDYSIIAFSNDGFLCKYTYAQTVYGFVNDVLETKFKNWHYINVYARRSGRFIRRYYKGNFIDARPQ